MRPTFDIGDEPSSMESYVFWDKTERLYEIHSRFKTEKVVKKSLQNHHCYASDQVGHQGVPMLGVGTSSLHKEEQRQFQSLLRKYVTMSRLKQDIESSLSHTLKCVKRTFLIKAGYEEHQKDWYV